MRNICSFRNLCVLTLALFTLFTFWSMLHHKESSLEIRSVQAGVSIPDGFFVWHHLNANGIAFKSITPHRDALLIKFDSSEQSDAAKEVLIRSLPQGYVIAQSEDKNLTQVLLSHLKSDYHRIG